MIDEGTAVALAYGILKGGLPSAGAEHPLTVAFVDIGHSCTQVRDTRIPHECGKKLFIHVLVR